MRRVAISFKHFSETRNLRTSNGSHEPLQRSSSQTIISLTKMITNYGKNGDWQKSLQVFDGMSQRNQITWNAMLTVLVDAYELDSAHHLFDEMPCKNSTSYTLMISGLSRCGCVVEAREVFDSILPSHQNVISWTAMISCYIQNHQPLDALKLFTCCYGNFFVLRILPNSYTFTILLKACTAMQCLVTASQIHALIVKLLDEEDRESVFIQNSFINLHSKFGSFVEVEKIFSRMKWRDLSTWNTIMASYAHHLLLDKALKVFNSMKEKDTLSWNIIISCLAESGHGEEAFKLFLCLLRLSPELKPNASTYTIVLTVCATLTALELGRQVHTQTIKLGMDWNNVFTANSLIAMYTRCGSINESEQVFNEMPKKDVISWNSLILGLGQNGHARKALEVAEQALKLESFNHRTFIGILTSCSHGGLVDEGMEYFRSMSGKYGIEPTLDHYICIIDMLGRAGRIIDAHDVLHKMPFEANSVAWAALLSACLVHGDGQVGEIVAQELQNLEPGNAVNYVMLANIYRKFGRVEDSRKVLNLMKEKGLRKELGRSWIIDI